MHKLKYVFILSPLLYLGACKMIQPLIHNIPKEKNANLFAKRKISRGFNVFKFKESYTKNLIGKAIRVDEKNLDPNGVSLDDMLKLHNTISFLIIRNDSILLEKYAANFKDSSTVSSFSIAKSFISTLIGMAIEDGFIKNVQQPLTDFIPELANKGFSPITISHLLKHTSGIRFSKQPFNPFSDNAQFYYGNNLRNRMLEMKIAEPPGLHFNYQSENYQLLGLIIERVTNQTISAYLQKKIWEPLGMEHNAFWNLDNNGNSAMEKAFCCLNATTRDFAKLGRLYLENGNWNGKQLISKNWISMATQPDTTDGGKFNFQYNWLSGPEKYGSYYAVGLYGQYIYVYPEKKIILVRFGREDLNYNPSYWKSAFIQIIDQL